MNLNGNYRLLLDGREIVNSPNAITVAGKKQIHAYLAGVSSTWASAISIGAGNTAASSSDTHLDFEISRDVIVSSQANSTDNTILLKAEFPDDLECVVYETGVHSSFSTSIDGGTSQLLTDFSTGDGWTQTTDSIVPRIGAGMVKVSSTPAQISNLDIDFSGYSSTDYLYLSTYFAGTSGAKTISVSISDGTTTYSYSFSANLNDLSYTIIPVQYNVGSPSTITSISVSSSSSGSIYLDGLRINNATEYGTADILVSRSVLGTPVTKKAGSKLEVEYTLAVS